MCQRERVDAYVFEFTSSDGVTLSIESPTGFKLWYKEKCHNDQLQYWTQLPSQGR